LLIGTGQDCFLVSLESGLGEGFTKKASPANAGSCLSHCYKAQASLAFPIGKGQNKSELLCAVDWIAFLALLEKRPGGGLYKENRQMQRICFGFLFAPKLE